MREVFAHRITVNPIDVICQEKLSMLNKRNDNEIPYIFN